MRIGYSLVQLLCSCTSRKSTQNIIRVRRESHTRELMYPDLSYLSYFRSCCGFCFSSCDATGIYSMIMAYSTGSTPSSLVYGGVPQSQCVPALGNYLVYLPSTDITYFLCS